MDTEMRHTVRHDISSIWVKEQEKYHSAAGKKLAREARGCESTVRKCSYITVAVYLAVLVYEILASFGVFGGGGTFKLIMKILLGTLSALTLFVSGYFGRTGVFRQSEDSAKMEKFFRRISGYIEENGQSEELLLLLAREELSENSNWCSYKTEDEPSLSL